MFLYILSESESDEIFYGKCVNKITNRELQRVPRKLRKGSGLDRISKNVSYFLQDIKYSGHIDNTFFIILKDNDRRPQHPDHQRLPNSEKLIKKEQTGTCRFCELERIIIQILGQREDWPIQGAIAVPVQMKESWLLLIINKEVYLNESSLPIFSEKDRNSVKKYYSTDQPIEQLKDLCNIEKQNLKISRDLDFNEHCGEQLNPKELSEISPSFGQFKDQIKKWRFNTR